LVVSLISMSCSSLILQYKTILADVRILVNFSLSFLFTVTLMYVCLSVRPSVCLYMFNYTVAFI